jgi:hypothetical protein
MNLTAKQLEVLKRLANEMLGLRACLERIQETLVDEGVYSDSMANDLCERPWGALDEAQTRMFRMHDEEDKKTRRGYANT